MSQPLVTQTTTSVDAHLYVQGRTVPAHATKYALAKMAEYKVFSRHDVKVFLEAGGCDFDIANDAAHQLIGHEIRCRRVYLTNEKCPAGNPIWRVG